MASGTGISTGGIETGAGRRRRWGRRRGRRRWPVVLGLVVLLLAALLGGAGWYYAGQIEAEALHAAHTAEPQRYDLVVDSSAGGGIVLRRTSGEPAPDPLVTGGTYGLVWPGGSGTVERRWSPSPDGRRPWALQVVRGDGPVPGTPAALTDQTAPDPQAAFGTPYQDVSYPCAGGSCPAWFVPGQLSTWWIAVHGKGSTRAEGLRAFGAAGTWGMPGLLIGYRNDPDAPADPSGRYGYGVTEWRDLQAAVEWAHDHGARHVVLYGASMGGAIVAAFLEHSADASLVSGVVLDAPALDLGAAVALGAEQRRLPVLGTGVPGVLTSTAEWIAGRRYGVDWDAVDYVPGNWLHVPALVFHGTADTTVPIATSDELQRAHPRLVEEVRVDGAGHVQAWNADRSAYESRETSFLVCVLTDHRSCPEAGVNEVDPAG